eukprot:TRINITY_DN19458_c0_g1_i1.p1 TRINITY_DN19458_c0_g1~~TRINITY_DN19458_c0_g1_i1.p1  ORF type:complete len:398 (+),score=124.76 TRINITY_DN19458_c0_g1_i1:129-1322(+)
MGARKEMSVKGRLALVLLVLATWGCVQIAALNLRHAGSNALVGDVWETTLKNAARNARGFDSLKGVITGLLQTKTPTERVYAIFENLIAEVNAEQFRHDEIAFQENQKCEEEFSFRRMEINNATISLKKAKESHGRCTIRLTKSNAHLALNQQIQRNKEDELKTLDEIREIERRAYARRQAEHNAAIAVIEGALPLVEKLGASAGSSFAEVKPVAKNAIELLSKLFSTAKASQYSAIASALAQLTASPAVQASDVARLLELLNTLRNDIQSTLATYTANENKAIEAYNTNVASVNGILSTLRAQEKALKSVIYDAESCIAQEDEIIIAADQKINRNTELKQYAEKMCKSAQDSYELATRARMETIQLYKKIIEWLRDYFEKHQSEEYEDTVPEERDE